MPLDDRGEEKISTTWTVDCKGNIFYTAYDNKNISIQRMNNRWYDDIGISSRHIGRFTKNHVPLYKTPSESAEIYGYNFDNDVVWEKETKGEWSRIQKLDGREGWVKTTLIDFNDYSIASKPSCNVAVDKIMCANDNLRLRKQEATSSEIINTMLKGTKVKILQLGKEDVIDGIKSCWVQVEVLAGGKDKNGKEIKEGTIGWCYGGFLG